MDVADAIRDGPTGKVAAVGNGEVVTVTRGAKRTSARQTVRYFPSPAAQDKVQRLGFAPLPPRLRGGGVT